MSSEGLPDYGSVTEGAGSLLTPEAVWMIQSRYAYAAELAKGKRVLELGCGAGEGMALVGDEASFLVGGDIDADLLARGRAHYGSRFPFVRLSAEDLPFGDDAFDTVLFFEATYYVPDMERAFDEIKRVLGTDGTVVFVNANPERPDFIRSPFSQHYHTAAEFRSALRNRGFDVVVEGAFPTARSVSSALIGLARRALRALGLVPRSLEGRAKLKKLLYRDLHRLGPEVPAPDAAPPERAELDGQGPHQGHKVMYVTGQLGPGDR